MSSAEPTTPDVTPSEAETTTVPISTPSEPTGNWRDSLPADIRSNPTLESIDSVESLAKEHINVQKMIGTEKIERPKDDWTPEQFNEFYGKLGRPAEAKDYDLDGIERPEGLPWDDGFQESMIGIMHEAGLTQGQVKKILGGYIESVGGQFTQATGEASRTRESAVQDLRNEWGKSFDAQVDLAKRAFRSGTGENFEAVAGLKMADGGQLGDHPAVIRAFAALGGKMNEHGLVGGVSSRATLSPGEATSERNKLMSDQSFLDAYLNAEHLEHDVAVKKMQDLTNVEVGVEGV